MMTPLFRSESARGHGAIGRRLSAACQLEPTTFWVSYGSGGLGLFTVNLIGLLVENLTFHNIERISLRRWGMGAQS